MIVRVPASLTRMVSLAHGSIDVLSNVITDSVEERSNDIDAQKVIRYRKRRMGIRYMKQFSTTHVALEQMSSIASVLILCGFSFHV